MGKYPDEVQRVIDKWTGANGRISAHDVQVLVGYIDELRRRVDLLERIVETPATPRHVGKGTRDA